MPTTRSGSGRLGGDRGDRQRGGVGGEDRLRPAGLGELGEQLAASARGPRARPRSPGRSRRGRRARRRSASAAARGLGLLGAPHLALDALRQRLDDPLGARLERLRDRVLESRSRSRPGRRAGRSPRPSSRRRRRRSARPRQSPPGGGSSPSQKRSLVALEEDLVRCPRRGRRAGVRVALSLPDSGRTTTSGAFISLTMRTRASSSERLTTWCAPVLAAREGDHLAALQHPLAARGPQRGRARRSTISSSSLPRW